MKKVLVIAYYFPPLGGSGVQRILKFVKYLPQFGWSPTVLTVGPISYYAKDDSLLREIESEHITVVRTNSIDHHSVLHKKNDLAKMPTEGKRKILSFLSDFFFIPDNKIGWKRKAVKAASELLNNEPYDVIFATSPPMTDFLIGVELKKRHNIPLIVDYRDSWLKYPFKHFPTPLHRYAHYRLERSVLRAADVVTTTSRRTKEELLQRYNFMSHNDIVILPHGFDPEDVKVESPAILPNTEKMRITYSGMFYANITPMYFLQALSLVFKNYPHLHNKIEACFVGLFKPEYINRINQLGLQRAVNILGYLEHKDAVRYLLASDVLWVMTRDKVTTPGKIFEYIGTRKKILGCISNDYLRSIIEEGNGVCVTPNDVQEIANIIVRLYQEHQQQKLCGASQEVAEKYNRIMLTGELAKIFAKQIQE